jgi:Ca2+-binding EF-hand superfamily protein
MPLSNRLSTTSFQEIEEMKTIMDTNGNGIIEFTEFEHMMAIKIIERVKRSL